MPRYIDADVAQRIADAELTVGEAGIVQHVLQHTITADVQEVWHGRWISVPLKKYPNEFNLICSLCNKLAFASYDFCPHCGAKMDND